MKTTLLFTVAAVLAPHAFAQRRISPPVPTKGDEFGVSVAMSGPLAIIGAVGDDEIVAESGAAYVYDVITGALLHKLKAADLQVRHRFGEAVGLSGTIAVVGAPRDEEEGEDTGAAYVFDAVSGAQLFKLKPPDPVIDEPFGHSVAVAGGKIVVGRWLDGAVGDYAGSVYVFDAESGALSFKLIASDAAPHAHFGSTVAISGNRILVGALGDDEAGPYAGAAYVFDATTGAELRKLTASDASGGEKFGGNVGLRGPLAVIGAFDDDHLVNNGGAAYLFDVNDGRELAKLVPSDGMASDSFGWRVAISGSYVAVYSSPDALGWLTGAVYVFDVATREELYKILQPGGDVHHGFGRALALSDTRLLVGVPLDDQGFVNDANAGAAYFVPLDDLGTVYCSPAAANSTGQPGVVATHGGATATDTTLMLGAHQLPPGKFGYFLTSAAQGFVANPGGSDGDLCLGGAIGRFSKQIQQANGDGYFALQTDPTALPTSPPAAIQAGETWNFQAWYRDSNPGSTSNFTNARSILFR